MKTKTTLMFLTLSVAAIATAAPGFNLTLSSGNPIPGGTATFNLSLTGSAGANLAALQWTIPIIFGTPTVVAGQASTAASKNVSCAVVASKLNCISIGMNQTLFADGVVATISMSIPATQSGTIKESLAGTLGTDPAGAGSIVVSPGTDLIFNVFSPCDLNSDGVVDVVDAQISVNQILGVAACGNGDLNKDGACTVADGQREFNAPNGGVCRVGP